jgi:DNA polymerase III epsilon subunit-like protein
MTYFLCVDLETTDRVISNAQMLVGCFILLDQDMREIDRRIFKVRHRYWDRAAEQAVAIHGITREQAERFPYRHNVVSNILKWIPDVPGGIYFVCHANRSAGTFGVFDRQVLHMMFLDSFLEREGADHFTFDRKCPASKVISTHTLARKFLSLEKYNLKSVADHFGIPLVHHNAESDAVACSVILRRLSKMGDIFAASSEEYEGRGVSKDQKKRAEPKPNKARGVDWYE